MRISRSALRDRVDRLARRNEDLVAERDAARKDRNATASALLDISGELSRMKDVVASHAVAAGHPSAFLQSPQQAFDALLQGLDDAGVDLRLELARLGVER